MLQFILRLALQTRFSSLLIAVKSLGHNHLQ